MTIDSNNFKKISIRGRAAYGITCLENALSYYNLTEVGWKLLLEKFWRITYIKNDKEIDQYGNYTGKLEIDDLIFLSEYLPENLLEFKSFYDCKDGFDSLTIDEFNILKKTYRHSNSIINNIISNLFNLCTEELYGGIHDYSPETLKYLQNIIDIMYANKITLPDLKAYSMYDYNVIGKEFGWGEPFDGRQYSKFLKPD